MESVAQGVTKHWNTEDTENRRGHRGSRAAGRQGRRPKADRRNAARVGARPVSPSGAMEATPPLRWPWLGRITQIALCNLCAAHSALRPLCSAFHFNPGADTSGMGSWG